ncbi:MAG: thiamine pyrophosphate-dependent enzyme [Hyphomicrobiaceae bacterium]|nr:thiamine pyrophosphate-dependent enzyme [Hyphomicrobiaceae bacterium]
MSKLPAFEVGKAVKPRLNRRKAIVSLLQGRADDLFITGIGAAKSDVLAAVGSDSPIVFPLDGAMGCAVSVGLGLALTQPSRRIVVVTGDGELLMNLGSLAVVGVLSPANLIVVCIDNEHYGECGFQPTHTAYGTDLATIAYGSGITNVLRAQEWSELLSVAEIFDAADGPSFVLLKTSNEMSDELPRTRDAAVNKYIFRQAVAGITVNDISRAFVRQKPKVGEKGGLRKRSITSPAIIGVRRPSVSYVLAARSLAAWIEPFVQSDAFDASIAFWENGEAPPTKLRQGDPAVLLSTHDTLFRDAELAENARNIMAHNVFAAKIAHDKHLMATHAQTISGLTPIPEFSIESAAEYLAQAGDHTILAKKISGTEGVSNIVIGNDNDLRKFEKSEKTREYLLQPFISGDEISVNLILGPRNSAHIYHPVGKGKSLPNKPHPALRERRFPLTRSCEGDFDVRQAMDVAKSYAAQIRSWGIYEIELIYKDGKLYFLEVNPRISATLRMSMVVSERNVLLDLANVATFRPIGSSRIRTKGVSEEFPLGKEEIAVLKSRMSTGDGVHFSSRRVTVFGRSKQELLAKKSEITEILSAG